jgi:DNA-binding MarR family transcriptional regulator
MDNMFLKDLNDLAQKFHDENTNKQYDKNIAGFTKWIAEEYNSKHLQLNVQQPDWKGKEEGRSPESVISTLIVHLNRYANRYSEAAIAGSDFVAQDDFAYLIHLKALGPMTKEELIKSNVHDKNDGIKVISRLKSNGWVENTVEISDNLSNHIQISDEGRKALQNQMKQIRKASLMVAGDLTHHERIDLIKILTKLELHHQSVFSNCDINDLIKMMQ